MAEPLIRDIPSIRKILEDIQAFGQLRRAMPLLRPLLRLLGAGTDRVDEALLEFEDLSRQAEELACIPDRFNDLFADRGWITMTA